MRSLNYNLHLKGDKTLVMYTLQLLSGYGYLINPNLKPCSQNSSRRSSTVMLYLCSSLK